MRQILIATLLFLTQAESLWAQEHILVGGAGGVIPVMQELAHAYHANNPHHRVEIMPTSLGATGGMKAAEAGRVAIGLAARPLRPEETGRLVYRPLGRVPAVFAVHRDIPITSLTESQVCDIYAGRLTSWKDLGGPDSRIVVVTRNEDDPTKERMRQQVSCFRDLKERADAVLLTTSMQMSEALSNRPWTIGITDLGYAIKAEGRFRALAIGGVAPSAESMQTGAYKLSKEFGVVTLGQPQGLAKRFLEFVGGPEGEKILSRNGVVVLR